VPAADRFRPGAVRSGFLTAGLWLIQPCGVYRHAADRGYARRDFSPIDAAPADLRADRTAGWKVNAFLAVNVDDGMAAAAIAAKAWCPVRRSRRFAVSPYRSKTRSR